MTLEPILQGAQDWLPPGDYVLGLFERTHFAQRCRERGVRSVPGGLLLWVVKEALERRRTDLVEPVFRICDESELCRILLPEGAFYPVLRGGCPVTIYTAAQKREMQRVRRARKRHKGTRLRRAVAQ